MARQLNLDRDKLDQCYEIAGHVIALAWKYIQRHSSKAIERATLLYLGVEGEYRGESLASRLVASLTKDQLRLGAAYWWGEALAAGGQDPKDLINRLIRGKVKWDDLPKTNPRQIRQLTEKKSGAGTAAPAPNFSFGLRLKEAKPKRLRHAAQDWLKKQEGMALLELASSKKFQDFWSEEEYREAWEPASARQTVLVLGGLNSPEQAVWAGAKNFYFLQPDGLNEILRKEMDTHRGLVDLSFVLTVCAQGGAKVLSPRLTGKPASW
ncbi:MAG: hypothetical protein HY609_04770, partial [Deltaproteobacteria bacterium]|nr:hypothetical protein [Deltaproteobacteria bacterium]